MNFRKLASLISNYPLYFWDKPNTKNLLNVIQNNDIEKIAKTKHYSNNRDIILSSHCMRLNDCYVFWLDPDDKDRYYDGIIVLHPLFMTRIYYDVQIGDIDRCEKEIFYNTAIGI